MQNCTVGPGAWGEEDAVWETPVACWLALLQLEDCSEALVWVACGVLVYRGILVLASTSPRASLGGLGAWLGWLCWQAFLVPGSTAVQDAQRRVARAVASTGRVVQEFGGCVAAWVEVFLPFVTAIVASAWTGFWALPLEQRVALALVVVAGYAMLEAYRMLRAHEHTLKKVLFHASFLAGGPILWLLVRQLSPEWLGWCVKHSVSTVAVSGSLAVLLAAKSLQPADPPTDGGGGGGGTDSHPVGFVAPPPTTNMEMQILWLSYWACWPLVRVLEALVAKVPFMLPHGDPGRLCADLQCQMLVFVAWLQLWQGSRLLNRSLRRLLFGTNMLGFVAGCFGAPGRQALGWMQRAGEGGGRPNARLFALMGLAGPRALVGAWLHTIPQVGGLTAAICVLVPVVLWAFYSTLRMVSQVASMLLWCLAALDTADVLIAGLEQVYPQKLAFWTLARLWSAATKLPYLGSLLSLATPFAFVLFHIAGGPLLNGLLLPLGAGARRACTGRLAVMGMGRGILPPSAVPAATDRRRNDGDVTPRATAAAAAAAAAAADAAEAAEAAEAAAPGGVVEAAQASRGEAGGAETSTSTNSNEASEREDQHHHQD